MSEAKDLDVSEAFVTVVARGLNLDGTKDELHVETPVNLKRTGGSITDGPSGPWD